MLLPSDGRKSSQVPGDVIEVLLLLVLLHEGFDSKPANVAGLEVLSLVVVRRPGISLCRTDDE